VQVHEREEQAPPTFMVHDHGCGFCLGRGNNKTAGAFSLLPLSTKECNSRFSMSQNILTLTKDIEESNNIHETK
jgi:hypothetical protein